MMFLKIDGAKGLKLSLNLIFKFKFLCISLGRGSAIIDLAPSALGPYSDRPENQPTELPSLIFAIFELNSSLLFPW